MSDAIRVLVVDDHQIVREGLRMMLEELGEGFVVVGDAADGVSALRLVEELQPAVVLLDLRLPKMDGLTALAQIRRQWPHVAVVILTTYNEEELMVRGLQAGACGYLLKDTDGETLFRAIRTAARGELLLQPELMTRVLAYTTRETTAAEGAASVGLTEREQEILMGVARGERSKEIALRLGIAMRTVTAHLTSIYLKLGVDSRASAVAAAMERGLLAKEPPPKRPL